VNKVTIKHKKPRKFRLIEKQQHLTHWQGRSTKKLCDTSVVKASQLAPTMWDTPSWIQSYTQLSMAAQSNGVKKQKSRQLRSNKANWDKQKCANIWREPAQSTESINLSNFERLSNRCNHSSRLSTQRAWVSWDHTQSCRKAREVLRSRPHVTRLLKLKRSRNESWQPILWDPKRNTLTVTWRMWITDAKRILLLQTIHLTTKGLIIRTTGLSKIVMVSPRRLSMILQIIRPKIVHT